MEVKVIAIKLPFDLEERILTFPFLHALRELYPEAEIHFITPQKHIEVLNLLPFRAYYHEFDDGEIKSVFDVHRYTVAAKIFNVDIFFSLTNSFADASLGLGLRAKERVGFSDNWKTLVLTQKTPRPVNHHLVEDFLALYRLHSGQEASTKVKVLSRDLTPIIEDWDKLPYIAINLSPVRDVNIEDEWVDLVSMFENQRIVFFASDDQEKTQLLMENFLKRLPKKNLYVNFSYKSLIDLGKMLAFSKGMISYEGWAAGLSSYVGSRTLALYDRQDPQRTAPLYFLSDLRIMTKKTPRFQMSEVFANAMEFFRLS